MTGYERMARHEVNDGTTPANNLVYERPEGFTDTPTHYCPGCTHGVAHRLVAEVLEEMGVIDKTIGVAPVGCCGVRLQLFRY